ncbi:MAG: RNB domain-containing ribonuclease [Planctomycetes bacterium]|nr:RNB domain-containing ribonuclease [Planctomycetota bacterium]
MSSHDSESKARSGGPTHATRDTSHDRERLTSIARRAMLERNLEPDFPPAALKELTRLHAPAVAEEGLRDLRELLWAAIDNDDSRDIDQLTVAESEGGGRVRVRVAIADVDALVRKGSALDLHAAANTTSVYTPAVVFPMLPAALSTDLTSLNQDGDRLALVVDMLFDAQATLLESDIYRARVRNRAQLAYPSMAVWLEGHAQAPARVREVAGLAENLRLQDQLAQRLVESRHRNGALDFETLETRAVFQGEGISSLELDRKNRAKQLIEDFMIAANGVGAKFLAAKKFPSIRRVLRSPERWDRIVAFAASFGSKLPGEPDAVALEAFLLQRRKAEPEKFADLSLVVIKLIGRGEYALDLPGDEAPGHFGLAVKDYTHSTAPNRRYPDLITQRLLKAAIAGAPPPYALEELGQLAKHCTDQEDAATKVERSVRKSAAALLLSDRLGASFDAVVSGASMSGTWVRLCTIPVEGRVEQGFQGLDVGDRVRVKLVHTDVERGFIDFVRV